jgi:hypothetical protein
MTDIHSCSYYCDRPDCIKTQRDELRDKVWVGLTDAEIDSAMKSCNTTDTYKYFRAIEQALKEKNV